MCMYCTTAGGGGFADFESAFTTKPEEQQAVGGGEKLSNDNMDCDCWWMWYCVVYSVSGRGSFVAVKENKLFKAK